LLQVKTNLTTSAKSTKAILFDRKIIQQKQPKNRMNFDKTSPWHRSPQQPKYPATQRKKQPNCVGKPPNWHTGCKHHSTSDLIKRDRVNQARQSQSSATALNPTKSYVFACSGTKSGND